MKEHATDWEKTFSILKSDKGLVSRIYVKNSYYSIMKKTKTKQNTLSQKWSKELNRHITKGKRKKKKKKTNKHVESCSTLLVIREMQF